MQQRKLTYFLSDLHLGAKYLGDSHDAERRIVQFLDSIKQNAKAIYLLGDIFDYWFEYRYVVPRGFVRFLGKIAELSDMGIEIVWFIGNHDIWIFDYLPNELGVKIIDGSLTTKIENHTFFITHGDGVGKISPSFKLIRSIFRNKICQSIYAAIHPRWTIPFALNWSNSSRQQPSKEIDYRGADNEPLIIFAKKHKLLHPDINFFIFGHRHIVVNEQITSDCNAVIIGDWIRFYSYAVYDGNSLKLLTYQHI